MSKPGRNPGGRPLVYATMTEASDMTAWLLYLFFLLAPLVMLIVIMAG